MNIGSLNSAYADFYKTEQSATASKLENELDADFNVKSENELMDACKEFEAYFLEMMFKEMMKTVPKSEDSSSYGNNLMNYYQDNMIQEISSKSTETNDLGMAQMLYEQMKINYSL